MLVEELIRALQACDPRAVVLIPRDGGDQPRGEAVAEVTLINTGGGDLPGAGAGRSAVRLSGFASLVNSEGPDRAA